MEEEISSFMMSFKTALSQNKREDFERFGLSKVFQIETVVLNTKNL